MAPSKVAKACKEMKKFGIAEETVKPVLKNLLDVYDKNWKYIEDENYRLLLNAIFDNQNTKKEELTKREFKLRDVHDECEPPIKEYRTRSERNKSSPSVIASSAGFVGTRLSSQPRVEALEFQSSEQESGVKSSYRTSSMPPEDYKEKGRNSSAPHHCSSLGRRCPSPSFSDTKSSDSCPEETYLPLQHRRSKRRLTDEGGSNFVPDVDLTITPDFPGSMEKELYYHNEGLHEAMLFIDEMPGDEVPRAVIHPDHASSLNKDDFSKSLRSDSKEHAEVFSELMDLDADDKLDEDGSSHEHHSDAKEYDSKSFELITSNAEHNSTLQLLNKACSANKSSSGLRMIDSDYLNEGVKDDSQSQIELASSHNGEVEISLTINSSAPSNFNLPSLDAVFKAVEVCECFSAAKSIETDDEQVDTITVQPTINVIKKSNQLTVLDERIDKMDKPHSPVFQVANDFKFITSFKGNTDGYVGRSVMAEGYGKTNSREIVLKQGTSLDNLSTATYFVDDITRGEETNKISLVNEINNECQPTFYYITKNITYQNAYVKFLLARISDENCCSNCVGDCMSLEIPCACAGETGGEFAYTPHGLVKDDFLQRCFSVNLNHEKNLFYCKDCPLQRSNDEKFSNKCSGHIVRKFIKECWYKCGCGKSCGNRVVQRGISANLQVFMTPEGKGWGLRTLEDLPKGSFICEYVGEIVTNTELDDRNKRSVGEKHTYPVLLDADWGSEGVLKDEEALCLDATNYGNVARFINHRCKDANMVEIPVEVETPDHHYYHLAFFTIRDVKALEELTWDYGIDFSDTSHPVKAFNCRCGSKFCKLKRRKRPRTSY